MHKDNHDRILKLLESNVIFISVLLFIMIFQSLLVWTIWHWLPKSTATHTTHAQIIPQPTPTPSTKPIVPSLGPTPTLQTVISFSPTPIPTPSLHKFFTTKTPTPTPTSPSSVTNTPGATSTPTSGSTNTSTPTPTASDTPTSTPTPTATYTPTPGPCDTLTNTTYDSLILEATPAAYYTFSESMPCDHSGNGLHGTKVGNIASTTLLNGDSAWDFDGASYVEVADNDALSITAGGAITVEAWMRPDSLQFADEEGSGYVYWVGKGEPNQHEYVMRMYSFTNSENRPNRISGYSFNLTGGLGVGSYFQDAVTAGNWIYAALVVNTTNTSSTYPMGYTKIFKNGTQRDQDTMTGFGGITPMNGTAPFRIGTRDFNSYFEGAITKIAIYNYELSPFTILDHYQEVVPNVVGTAALVNNIGSTSTKTAGTTLTITVNKAVPAGDTVIVRVLTDHTAAGPTAIDSQGNTYTRDRTAPNGATTMRASIFSSRITTPLQVGDTITITSSSVASRVAVADHFSGLLTTAGYLDQQNATSNSSTTPGTTISVITTNANDLILGFVGVEGPTDDTYTEDLLGQYASLTREGTLGDTDDTNLVVNGGYRSVSTTGTYQYRPTLDPTRNWILFIMAYKAS